MKLKTTTLKRGLLLYHGTSSPDFDERAGSMSFPAWFSEKKRVARYFVNWHGEPEPFPYNEELPSSARIITYRVAQPIKVLLIRDRQDMDFIEEQFGINADDVETLADWVCSNGYGGWIIPNNYPAEGGSDIMLCQGEGLEYVDTESVEESLLADDAREIVNFLIEARSTSLELANAAARWIYHNDPEFFEGGCADVVQVIRRFLEAKRVPVRLVTGYAVFRNEKVPHVWLEIEGQQFDPTYALQRITPKSYEPVPMELGDFGVDEESGYHDELVHQLQREVVIA